MEQRKAYQQLEAVLALGSASPTKSPGGKAAPASPSTAPAPDEPEEEDVARAFSVYDRDGTGEISTLDVEGLMRDLNVPLSAVQLSQAISQLDPEQTGKVSFGEFLLWWKG